MQGRIPFQLIWTGRTGAQPQSWPRNKCLAECAFRSWSLINGNVKCDIQIFSGYSSAALYAWIRLNSTGLTWTTRWQSTKLRR